MVDRAKRISFRPGIDRIGMNSYSVSQTTAFTEVLDITTVALPGFYRTSPESFGNRREFQHLDQIGFKE
jgi:hypothetical protein